MPIFSNPTLMSPPAHRWTRATARLKVGKNVAVTLTIPAHLLPADGRFGAGPSKIRPEALATLAERTDVMGTSHRQAPVRALVAEVQQMLTELYQLPDDYRVVLSNGGTNAFWDVAVSSLVENVSAHGVFGEFGRKFADACAAAPFLRETVMAEVPAGQVSVPTAVEGADVYAWPQNETSTAASAPAVRPVGIADDALVLIDATSAAGGMAVDVTQVDGYYFSPQKNFAADGGMWFALVNDKLIERAQRIKATERWIPPTLDFTTVVDNSAKHQTYNTPSVANLVLVAEQARWILDNGGLEFAVARTTESTDHLYAWAEANPLTTPFIANPADRSHVIATIDVDEQVSAPTLTEVLRANGIVDIEPYRSLGRNQIRVACYTSVDPDDVRALTNCIDWVIEHL